MTQIGIFTATRWEYRAVRRVLETTVRQRHSGWFIGRRGGCEVMLVRTGVGRENAGAACRRVLQDQPLDLVVSSGFACALGAANIGDLLIGTDVMPVNEAGHLGHADDPSPCDEGMTATAIQAARSAGVPVQVGHFATVSRVLCRAEDKREMAVRTGAIGLDMESVGLIAEARARQTPFALVRAVSDLVDEDLPYDFNLFLKPADWPRATLAWLAHPSALIGLNRLRIQTTLASERLTAFFERFFDDLS